MKIWEKSYIVLIKNNQELMDMHKESQKEIDELKKTMRDLTWLENDDIVYRVDHARLYFDGCKKEPVTSGWRKYKDGLFRPNIKSTAGKILKARIKAVARVQIKKWLDSKDLYEEAYEAVVMGLNVSRSVLSRNAEGTEFILFYPKKDGQDKNKVMQKLMLHGEIITEGMFIDQYKETHLYMLV